MVKLPKQNLVVVATASLPPYTNPWLGRAWTKGDRCQVGVPQRHTFARRKETWSGGDLDFIFVIIFPHFFSLSLQKLAIWVSTFAILTASPSSYPWFGSCDWIFDREVLAWPKFRNHWGGRDESEKSVETKLLSLVSLVFSFCFKTYIIVWHHFGSLSDPSPAGFCRLHPRHSRCFRPNLRPK